MAEIIVTPTEALADEAVEIVVIGLRQGEKVTIFAKTENKAGVPFCAFAHYVADNVGKVNVSTDEASGGSYVGIEPHGLLWALQPPKGKYSRLLNQVTIPQVICFSVYTGHVDATALKISSSRLICSAKVKRFLIDAQVDRIPVSEGRIRGTLFVPRIGGPFAGIISIIGLGVRFEETRAALLSSHGFITLALAHSRYADLPKDLHVVDLEYFEEAVEFLKKHHKVTKVGVIGHSQGGAITLAMVGSIPNIACAVTIAAPISSLCPIKHREKSWRRIELDKNAPRIHNGFIMARGYYVTPTTENIKELMPPFYDKDIPILYIYGCDDGTLHTTEIVDVLRRLHSIHSNKRSTIITYHDAGHNIEIPNEPLCSASYYSRSSEYPSWYGGRPREHAKAQEQAWKDSLNFFRKHLSSEAKL